MPHFPSATTTPSHSPVGGAARSARHRLPLMITSLLALVLLPVTGVMPSSKVYALFGSEAVRPAS